MTFLVRAVFSSVIASVVVFGGESSAVVSRHYPKNPFGPRRASPSKIHERQRQLQTVDPFDLSQYGYPYSHDASSGFLTFPPEADPTGSKFAFFDPTDNVTSVESCAARCSSLQAKAGAWNSRDDACWCYFIELGMYCITPCVEEVGIDFSTEDFNNIGYCEKSFCDVEWYYDPEYCDGVLGYDSVACDAKIATLGGGSEVGQLDDFSMYGYPYSMDASEGYQTFPPGFGEDQLYFNSTDGVNDARSCAAKCQELDASSGAWNPRWESCWCYFSQLEICKEPCLVEDGVEFSRTPLTDLSYCEKSLCDDEWYYAEYQEYCDVDMSFDSAACDAKIATLNQGPTSSTTTTAPPQEPGTDDGQVDDFSMYGYPYSMDASEGYQTFPPGFGEDQLYFNSTDGVNDARSCAAKCQELDASSGAWNPRWESCWCYFSQLEICKEPCLVEDGVEFSRTPLTDLSYCEKSLCDSEWYNADYQEYCDVDMGFDRAACDAKIASLSQDALVVDSGINSNPTKAPTPDTAVGEGDVGTGAEEEQAISEAPSPTEKDGDGSAAAKEGEDGIQTDETPINTDPEGNSGSKFSIIGDFDSCAILLATLVSQFLYF